MTELFGKNCLARGENKIFWRCTDILFFMGFALYRGG